MRPGRRAAWGRGAPRVRPPVAPPQSPPLPPPLLIAAIDVPAVCYSGPAAEHLARGAPLLLPLALPRGGGAHWRAGDLAPDVLGSL